MDLADDHQASSMDLFTFLSREAEKTLRRSAGLSVPQSAYDGSSKALILLPPQEMPSWSTVLCFSQRGGVSHGCFCHAWSSNTLARWREGCSESARIFICHSTVSQARYSKLAAAPPMPSSLAPTWCSEATPDELEQRLRFFARQIKSFRRTSLMYSSPELMERIRQMEGDYETAVSRALLLLLLSSPRQVYSLLQSFRRGPWAGCLHDQVLSTSLVSSWGCSWNSGLTHSLTHHSQR
ncbi:hypothetical protein CRENBAI_005695 [Crenichthys baileyi]|uniref:Uncharacterized protein n=1 Tax=Crenichthys baileyi TaxID=28760 RepID=A0AAV9S1A1_9TELE